MAIYRQVHVSFWQDSDVLDLTPEEKYFYLYLMTNSKTTQCGIYELPKRVMEMELGYNRETVDKLLQRFTEYGKIVYNVDTKEIMLLNWIKYNSVKSPAVKACIAKELNGVKQREFVQEFARICSKIGYRIDGIETVKGQSTDGIQTVGGDSGEEKKIKEEEKKRKEKEEEEKNKNFSSDELTSKFEEFWNVYPRKVGKKAALRVWQTRMKENIHPDELIRCTQNYAEHIKRTGTTEKYIKHASTFIGPDKHYEDFQEIAEQKKQPVYEMDNKTALDVALQESDWLK